MTEVWRSEALFYKAVVKYFCFYVSLFDVIDLSEDLGSYEF